MKRWVFLFAFCFAVLFSFSAHADGFLKGGFVLSPTEDDFGLDIDLSNRWLIAFGGDYGVAENVKLGYEVQSAYYSTELASVTLRYIPLNVFGNVKYKFPLGGVSPFVGGGMGMIATFFNANTDFDNVSDFGYHFLGGVELGTGPAFLLELQGQQAFADEADFKWIFFAGVRF